MIDEGVVDVADEAEDRTENSERVGDGVRETETLRRLDGGVGEREEIREGVAPVRVFSDSTCSS